MTCTYLDVFGRFFSAFCSNEALDAAIDLLLLLLYINATEKSILPSRGSHFSVEKNVSREALYAETISQRARRQFYRQKSPLSPEPSNVQRRILKRCLSRKCPFKQCILKDTDIEIGAGL